MFSNKVYYDSDGSIELYFVKELQKHLQSVLYDGDSAFFLAKHSSTLQRVGGFIFFKLLEMVQKSWLANTFLKKSIFQ